MQQGQPSGEHPHAQLTSDNNQSETLNDDPPQPQPGAVHCFWALMTYGDLRFIYLSNSVQRAVNSKYKRLLGRSFFDYIHPDEAKLARKDLNAFMDVHNLYGSVTRCRFKNVCPDWQLYQQQLRQQQQQEQQATQQLDMDGNNNGSSSSTNDSQGIDSAIKSNQEETAQKIETVSSIVDEDFKCNDPDAMKRYQDAFPNGEMDDYMILDVVMNVVSDQVVLGFFHIDGQGPYKGFWSGNRCGESKDSLTTLASEILRHLRESTASIPVPPPSQQQQGKAAAKDTKRIFQLYDTETRNLLLTWPEPSSAADDDPADATKLVYNPEFYTRIVQSHHIPADALANTTCLKRFCSKHAISGQGYPQEPSQPIFQVESVFIPYGQIIFACFQTSPAPSSPRSSSSSLTPSLSSMSSGSPIVGAGALQTLGDSYLKGSSGVSAGGSSSSSSATALVTSSGCNNSPLVIPSLPSLSPFLKHAVPGPTHSSAGGGGGGPISSSPLSGGSNNHFRPYPKLQSYHSGSTSSNSSSPLLDQPNKLGLSDMDRLNNISTWHASTPHPAMAAMVGHALSPSSPAFYRSNDNLTSTGPERRLPFPPDHSYHRERTVSSSAALDQSSSSSAIKMESDAARPRARTTSSPTFSNGSTKSSLGNSKSGSRHPAHDAAIRAKTAPSPASSGGARRELSSDSVEDSQQPGKSKSGGDSDSVVSTYSCLNGGLVIRISQEEKTCESCHTTNSPEWRRGPSGKKNLCNACGLRYSRSVARQNRQAQKLAEAKGGGAAGVGSKSKGAKKQKTSKSAATTAAAGSPSKQPSVEIGSPPHHSPSANDLHHTASSSTSPHPPSASLSLSPHDTSPNSHSHTMDPRQGYAGAAGPALGNTSPYHHHQPHVLSEHPPHGSLSSAPTHSHMPAFV